MPDTPRLLFVHAHPDDESLSNGATIAHYTARGAQVHVVTCTLGEEGEVIGDRWAQLAVDHADQLGGYRVGELTAALHELGVSGPIYLGGAGRWRDSGMAGTERRGRRRFVDADEREAVGALVAIIRELRPHVVVTYDPNGGYGHPDHVHTHTVTTAAVARAGSRAGTNDHPGEPWTVPKFYWTVLAANAIVSGVRALEPEDLRPEWMLPSEEIAFAYPDEDIDAVVETDANAHAAKVAALTAHATQVVVGPTGRACALSNNLALPILAQEHYVLVAGSAGDRDERGWETDLLAGLGFADSGA
ncbi:N-acetyl-1-D-myo-inositol-2-amino-2-deoxy-alpha-D-glucopyranoside deacetylase [Mycobacterium riyadhense]|uniref:1D-myo-inositol 2-acetamido-2-deoxy-alpha-D-glucopyranoside deacetylase n=1 Tax=Mycobacterium riyadhense TaxID=486698 RepID=A0A1X2BGQ1_9MYCO|nr:N-acetyl-1-D-myo-inositol-2-amino-2-deoxy-alpha-D-glucopyranoside deacetylase [Mycobacterium riyadhense]MCV7145636.1 N-acetyl-1-D-myo-inositol-2-amino-2-deoxy-alpha-D-glucopyranoside deacetylase [Mycobacterium riyadhense]ORW62836.1 N-acetyl-1-D-myo-inositol-2-amino-2-deoxy-alpha-D-glucopyranoside deacetylase [Mycobacterium riyadhense]VTP01099.1 1D-myo-inositol 2-acetamido-2-deoxy-alpha-D-glucopyranoside deacetylase [Mycobacterium riyadhense]